MNIAFMITPTAFGGAEKVGLTLLKHIDSQRYHFRIIALVRPWEKRNPFVEAVHEAGWPIHTIAVARQPRDQGRDYFRVLRCFRQCRALLKKHPVDLVHTNGYFANLIGIPASMSLGLASVSTCHGFIDGDLKLKMYNWLDKKILHKANRIIAVSDSICETLLAEGIRKEKIKVVSNAVQIQDHRETRLNRNIVRSKYRIEDHEVVVGYCGRLSKEKGLIYLIEAAQVLLKQGIPIKLLIIGSGPERSLLEKAASQSGITGNCIFTGFQTNSESLLPAMDIFVLPSMTEGTPMALLEAMAQGLPVVASNVGGIPKIIENQFNGLLIEAGDCRAIADAIDNILQKEDLRVKFGRNAIETIYARYGLEYWCQKMSSIYLQTVNSMGR
jgi:glycosyltransferase involved in cell wall biosynthesis